MQPTNNTTTLDALLANAGVSTRQESAAQLLDKFGLNWPVSKEPLLLPDGSPSGFFGITRREDGRAPRVFGTCTGVYEPVQNSELLELVSESAGRVGLSVDRGGLFKSGALVYLQLKTGAVQGIGENRDTIQTYATATNSHDGSSLLRWGLSSVTISCLNTFAAANRQLRHSVKHTTNLPERIAQIMGQIEEVREMEGPLYDTFFRLAEVPATKQHIADVVKIALNIDPATLAGGTRADISGYQRNRLTDLSAAINGEMRQKGATLWGLFSGLTRYTTHSIPGKAANREQSKAIGAAQKTDNAVFAALAAHVAA